MDQQLCSATYLLRLVKSFHKNGRLKVKVHIPEIKAFKRGRCTPGTHKAQHPQIAAACFLQAKTIHPWRTTQHFFHVKPHACTLHWDSMTIQITLFFFPSQLWEGGEGIQLFPQLSSGTLPLETRFYRERSLDIFIPVSDG